MRYLTPIVGFWLICLIGADDIRAQTPLAEPGQPGWSRTDEGCFVWNPKPQPNEAVSWSGGCTGGRASGSGLRAWRSGDVPGTRYEGTMRDGKEDGRGTLTYPNGNHYDGEWRDGKPNGQGQFVTSSVTLAGEWKDGCFNDGSRRAWVNVDSASCP